MDTKARPQPVLQPDHLGDYINRAAKLPAKIATIIAHQQESAAGLARAAVHLRAMAALGTSFGTPENRNRSLVNEKALDARA